MATAVAEAAAVDRATVEATREASPWRFVLAVWLGSRLFFLAAGGLAQLLVQTAWHGAAFRFERPGLLSLWATWDGAWYEDIARNGYSSKTSTAFFPLYPALVRTGTMLGLPPALAGIVVSLIAFAFALYFVYALAADIWDVHVARCVVLALAFFPTSFYFNAVYTESLFVALAAGAVWAALVRRSLVLAAGFGFFAAMTRNAGVLVLLPLAHEALRQRWRARALVVLAAVPAGLGAYMLYLKARWLSPLTFSYVQQQSWGRHLTDPATTLADSWRAARAAAPWANDPHLIFQGTESNPALLASNTYGFVFLCVAVVLLAVGAAWLPRGLWLFAFAAVLLPLLTPIPGFPLMGFPRYVLAAFPLFFVVGKLLARSTALLVSWLVVSAGFGVFLTAMFATWRWVA
jgi:Mannosyltransferase (PIG-V)